jgi:hypothetical protein
MSLIAASAWEQLEETCIFLKEKGIEMNDSDLFSQFNVLKKIRKHEVQSNPEDWTKMLCHDKWSRILQQIKFKE